MTFPLLSVERPLDPPDDECELCAGKGWTLEMKGKIYLRIQCECSEEVESNQTGVKK
jgi:hypothetical protein